MTPTLFGRIQTRIFLLATVGVVWTFLITPFLPGRGGLIRTYLITYLALAVVAAFGVAWEFAYHGLQQLRWERDWPTLYGLVTGINEGIVAFVAMRLLVGTSITLTQFFIHFASTWFLVWLVANGPMRVPFLHWRFRGGRLL